MKIFFHRNFEEKYKKLKNDEQKKVQERIALFSENIFNSAFNNHPLKGKHKSYKSINITGNLRAIYKFISDQECIFVDIDTHSNLYS
jgi:addiction module RelE/StbE family toxin